jgi:hypothetical protein
MREKIMKEVYFFKYENSLNRLIMKTTVIQKDG